MITPAAGILLPFKTTLHHNDHVQFPIASRRTAARTNDRHLKSDKGRQTVRASNEWTAFTCEGHTSVNFAMSPIVSKLDFEPGRGLVRARIANYQAGVQPADVTTRTRIVVD